jgi:predicted glycoside hydrolase/deacetylase ChbG (UPF0249 family)
MQELKAEEIEKQFDSYMELRDKVLDVLEGHHIRIILPMLTALIAETAFETGVELKEVLKLVATSYHREVRKRNALKMNPFTKETT